MCTTVTTPEAAVSRQQSAGSPGFQPDIPIGPIAVLMTGAKDALCANCDVTRLENVWTGGVGGGPGRLAGGPGKGGGGGRAIKVGNQFSLL